MPKNPLKFARRKSAGNTFDDSPEPPAPGQSSFRVLERPEKSNIIKLNGELKQPVERPFNSPLQQLRGRSAEELGSGVNRSVETGVGKNWLLQPGRGSGGTTNSGSSGYYESSSASARHSSSSTLPSSVDERREAEDEELFPRKSRTTPMYHTVAASTLSSIEEPPLPPPPSFKTRAARALSFGQPKNNTNGASGANVPPIPSTARSNDRRSESPQRERAMTTSSYASTAKPEVPLNLNTTDFGSEFSNMFDGPKNNDKYEPPLPPPPPVGAFHRTESEPMFPPRTHSRQAFKARPDELNIPRDDAGSPYSWDGRDSHEGLMSNSPLSSPRIDGAPVPPPHSFAPGILGKSKTGYSLVPERYSSPGPERLSTDSRSGFIPDGAKDDSDNYDSSGKQSPASDEWVGRVTLRDSHEPQSALSASSKSSYGTGTVKAPVTRKPLGLPQQAIAGASRAGALSPSSSEGNSPLWGSESRNTTPRAAKLAVPSHEDDSMFDSSPLGPASRAIKPQHIRTESKTQRTMTKAQFERLQRGDNSTDQSEEEDPASDEYDDEDEAEKAKKMAKQRRKQEANMSVYRQQMKKVTGGGPSDLPSMARPSLDRASASAPAAASSGISFHMSGLDGKPPTDATRGKPTAAVDDDDEDVPLGILQAHGFPSGGRPPTRQGENESAHQRRTSTTGSVMGGGAGQGNLPPFARRLPADPYFGSSVATPAIRENLAMSSAGSVYGGAPQVPQIPPMMQPQMQQPQMGHPGGLVGVIAGEERAKAARRGSPNPTTGTYGPGPGMPLPGNMPQMGGMPGMPRTMSMGNIPQPSVYTPSGISMMPGMPGVPPMPGMPMMPQMQQPQMLNQQNDQMQQFMTMQMQLMQNMLTMQQQQMGQTPPAVPPSQDYLGVQIPGNRQSIMSHAGHGPPSIKSNITNQGRAMTMMNPPTQYNLPPGAPRPNSAMPNTYAPSGLNIGAPGPGPGYTPSIAPSERSNIGMPSRYRPVTAGGPDGRSQSMTSTLTLTQPLGYGRKSGSTPDLLSSRHNTMPQQPTMKSTVRVIDKPKGTPKVSARPIGGGDDDDEGWAEMRKKRDDKKKFRFGRKSKDTVATTADVGVIEDEAKASLEYLYQHLD